MNDRPVQASLAEKAFAARGGPLNAVISVASNKQRNRERCDATPILPFCVRPIILFLL